MLAAALALAALITILLLHREADRVILTTCQEKGAHLETFQAISQKLGNKTAAEVRGVGMLCLLNGERGWEGRRAVELLLNMQPNLIFNVMLHQRIRILSRAAPCSCFNLPLGLRLR